MSVESEILRIQRNIANTYAVVAENGGTVPLQPNSENLPAAVSSIPAGGSSSEEVYSTEETRIGTFLGKPWYRKCYLTKTPNSNLTDIPVANIADLHVDWIKITGLIKGAGAYSTFPFVSAIDFEKKKYFTAHAWYNNVDNIVYLQVSNYINNAYFRKDCVIVLEYTKTTD